MSVNCYTGTRVNSRRYEPATQAVPDSLDRAYYEGIITRLFIPWIVKDIPENKWQTLQEKLGRVIYELSLKKSMSNNSETKRLYGGGKSCTQ
jgi:hypothetical protein